MRGRFLIAMAAFALLTTACATRSATLVAPRPPQTMAKAGPRAPGALTRGTIAINPTRLSFTPSADHALTLSDGTAILTSYELRLYLADGTAVTSTSLGKPTPSAGLISITNAALFSVLALNAEAYATVTAIGPGGSATSEPSNPFARLGPPGAAGTPVVQ